MPLFSQGYVSLSSIIKNNLSTYNSVASLDSILDVNISGITNKDILQWDSPTSKWVNVSIFESTVSSGVNSTTIGGTAHNYALSYGLDSVASTTGAVSVGFESVSSGAGGTFPTCVGSASTSVDSTVVGSQNNSSVAGGIIVGEGSSNQGGIVVGNSVNTCVPTSICVGNSVNSPSAQNTFLGQGVCTMMSNTGSINNTIIGFESGESLGFNVVSTGNTLIGSTVAQLLSSGDNNSIGGYLSGQALTTGSSNTMFGVSSGSSISASNYNTFFGALSNGVAGGADQCVFGYNSLAQGDGACVFGSGSAGKVGGVAFGFGAIAQTGGVAIGSGAINAYEKAVCIGKDVVAGGANEVCFRNDIATVSSGTALVYASDGQIGPSVSSIRYKESVKDLSDIRDKFMRIQPRSYRWKETGLNDIGIIAEELYKILPEFVPLDSGGQPRSVNYDRLSVLCIQQCQMLINENREMKHVIHMMKKRLEDIELKLST